jgi:hypothetical protein
MLSVDEITIIHPNYVHSSKCSDTIPRFGSSDFIDSKIGNILLNVVSIITK